MLKYLDDRPNGIKHSDEAHPQVLLHNLKNEKMKEAMAIENIFTYDSTWTPKGNFIVSKFHSFGCSERRCAGFWIWLVYS